MTVECRLAKTKKCVFATDKGHPGIYECLVLSGRITEDQKQVMEKYGYRINESKSRGLPRRRTKYGEECPFRKSIDAEQLLPEIMIQEKFGGNDD